MPFTPNQQATSGTSSVHDKEIRVQIALEIARSGADHRNASTLAKSLYDFIQRGDAA